MGTAPESDTVREAVPEAAVPLPESETAGEGEPEASSGPPQAATKIAKIIVIQQKEKNRTNGLRTSKTPFNDALVFGTFDKNTDMEL